MTIKLKFSFFSFVLIFAWLLLPVNIFADKGERKTPQPIITNSNQDSTAYFYIKKKNGKSEIIDLPPQSAKTLPPDTVEFQYLYMEGGDNSHALPELSSMTLTTPDVLEEYFASNDSMDEVKGPAEGRKHGEKKAAEPRPVLIARVLNNGDKSIVATVVTEDTKEHIIIVRQGEVEDLPKGSRRMAVHSQNLWHSRQKEKIRIKVRKYDGTFLEINKPDTFYRIADSNVS